jgi:predicted MPP superfamily phosphohydrolase
MARGLSAAALIGAAGLVGYAFLVEPYWVELTRHSLPGPVMQPLRIVQLSDLRTHGFGVREERVVELVAGAAPDIVVITGDVVEGASMEPGRELFTRLHAPLGLWVVRGEAENAVGVAGQRAFYRSLGVRMVEDEGALAREDLFVIGIGAPGPARLDPATVLALSPAAAFKLAIFHEPDVFTDVAGLFNLGLAGHTLGGQIDLPGLGPLFRPLGGRRYFEGWYTTARSYLYVSRGLGTVRIGARLGARPEVAVIEIRPM